MDIKIKTLDPTNNIVKEEILHLKTYSGNGVPMSQNFYIIEVGDIKIKINMLGVATII